MVLNEERQKQYNDIVHRFVLAYLESLNMRHELNFRELTSSKHKTKIRFPQKLNDRFVSLFLVRTEHL